MKRAAGLLLLFFLLGVSDIAAQNVSGVAISGTLNVGENLTGTYTGDMGATGDHYKYEWLISPTRTALPSTTVNYTLTASESGKGIYFKVSLLDASDVVLDSDSSSVYNVNTLPVASFPAVVGEARPGLTLYASYVYSDAEGNPESGSTFQWYTAGNSSGTGATPISLATSSSYKLKDSDEGNYIGFKVTPAASAGSSPGVQTTTSVFKLVDANLAPSAGTVTITGGTNVNDVLTGHYSYSDYEGDVESGSSYEWSRSLNSGGPFDVIVTSTGITHQIRMEDQKMYFRLSVTPRSATGTSPGTKQTSLSTTQKVNSKPYATGVYISGNDSVGQVVTGKFTFHDDDGDAQGVHLYQWFRDGNPISGATNLTYTLTVFDFAKQITFKITPVSTTGFPNTGDQVSSAAIGPIEDPDSPPPTADEICISGKRQTGQQLTGNYHYVNGYPEENSEKIWFRGKTKVKSSTSSNKYTLVADDIGSEIRFAVIPRNNSGETGDTVFSAPLAIFNLSRTIFSETDPDYLLQALPMGGIFSGNSVSDGFFHPTDAGEGTYSLTYVYTIEDEYTNCSQTAYTTVEVRPIVVEFFSVKPVYCDGNGTDTIYILNVPPTSFFNNFSISNPSGNLIMLTDTSAIFNPDLLSSGDEIDFIEYSYLDGFAFVSLLQPLVIEHIGGVSILNLQPGFQICSNAAPVELFTSHPGGVFAGPVVAGKLDPSVVPGGYGNVTVTYNYESLRGCKSSAVVPGRVNPLADISFTPADFCIADDNDSTKMVNNTLSIDGVKSWLWEFSEGGVTSTNQKEEPTFLYRLGGFYKIILTATTINDCVSEKEETFDIGRKPKAVLKWENECYRANDSILFIDKSISTSLIRERRWEFFGTDRFVNNKDSMRHVMISEGPMPVKFVVSNGYEGCEDSVEIDVYIRPTVLLKELTDKIYNEQFTSGNGGWVPDYDTLNTWVFGTPNRTTINSSFSGTNAWFTGYDVLNQKNGESSSIVSPCFDFTEIERPMIKMQLWKDFDRDRDGAVLQYRIGDSEVWEPVGTLEDGIRWFNSTLIKGRPGGDQIGWTSKGAAEAGYSEASHKLDFLKDSIDVKFRIAYGSNGTSLDNDGIAFDDIWIGSRSRQVLVEHFTNSSQTLSRTANEMVNEIASASQKDLINIQYHTNFSPDLYFNDNPGETGARILYYGLIRSPYTFLDGGTRVRFASTYDYNLADIDSNEVNRRSMVTPDFKIMLDADTSGGVLAVSGTVSALNDIDMENMTLYIAVTEKESDTHPGTNGETVFHNVFRKFLPNAGGVNLKKTWIKGDNVTIPSQSWVISNIAEDSDIEVIAFLQNNITRELYQAGSVKFTDIAVGINDLLQESGSDFVVYPNPVVNKLTVAFREPLRAETDINIYDIRGILVKNFKAGAGESQISTDDLNLSNGVYLLKVFNGRSLKGVKKLVVTGN